MKPNVYRYCKTCAASVIAITAFLSFAADTYTWIPGSTDWSSEDSYVEPGKPGEKDIVLIPDGKVATNKVVAGDAASLASFEAFSKLSQVKLAANSSKIVLDIGEGVSLTNYCSITCNAGNRMGRIVKRGLGALEFGVTNNASAYNCCLNVEEGLLALPQNITASALYLGDVVVSNGATLVTALDVARGTSIGAGPTYVASLAGGGDITNRAKNASKRLGFNVQYRTSTFTGRIRYGVTIFPSATSTPGVTVNLTGVESDTSGSVYVTDSATLGAAKFGLKGQASSIGKTSSLYWRGAGTFKYIGEDGDETDKNFYTWTRTDAPITLDAGSGGFTMTGDLGCDTAHGSEAYGMIRLTLTGSGTKTNVFAGTMSTWAYPDKSTNYNFHVTKKGTCVWRFADKAQTHAGAWTIEDGTLQFESLAQRGVACSLGTSTNCLKSYTGIIVESNRVDWAFALGGATTYPTFEYVGTNKVFCTTRPIRLKGTGGTLKSSSGKPFVLHGVSSDSGANATLTLAGDTAATNEIWNVANGLGTTSLLKDGSGTWILCGTNDFSGSLVVKAGTLIVKDQSLCKYNWFRWTVRERNGTNASNHDVRAMELGIYDENNVRMNGGLTTYANYGNKPEGAMPAGMAGYWHPKITSDQNNSRPLAALFDDGTPVASGLSTWTQMGYSGMPEITAGTESTWIPIVMHLTNTTARAKTFDIAQGNFSNYYAYKKFSMEGSVDGVHWDMLTNATAPSVAANAWTFKGGSASTAGAAATHTGGCPIAGGPKSVTNALGRASSVSVAAGARLVAEGVATISGLTVDVNGAGTIENFAFAAKGVGTNCTLNVKNLPKDGSTLPGTYVNCTGFGNIAGWTLLLDGEEARKHRISIMDGVLRVMPIGTLFIVR